MKQSKLNDLMLGISITVLLNFLIGFIVCWLLHDRFSFEYLINGEILKYAGFLILLELVVVGVYYYRHYWLLNSKRIVAGKKSDLKIKANLESVHFQTPEEVERNFRVVNYSKLKETDISGVVIKAEEMNKDLNVVFSKNTHVMVVGCTGSGKTTGFVYPTIDILSECKTKSSFLISDPKGEIHDKFAESLKKKGYQIKILDLREPFHSTRWNPLELQYKRYQRMLHMQDEVIPNEEVGYNEFQGVEYYDIDELNKKIKMEQQKIYDEVYEDLNDLAQGLIPITNKNEPIWETGAQSLLLAIMLAMLEDSENPETGMTMEKYNFYSIMKIATSTENEGELLKKYFENRSPLSKAASLAKQVVEAPDKTKGSYMSTLYSKLNLFADSSLCAMTSSNEIECKTMDEVPTAIFIKVADEKATRSVLASLFILTAYKELVAKANSNPGLELKRDVYFILDEFGNMPKVSRLENIITVGRSRRIWLNLIIQSYSQLENVYDKAVAEIVKSNCNVQIFIGSTSQETIQEFSKRCGNFEVIQRTVGFNSAKGEDISSNTSVKERPLIYPSELQMLNYPGHMGNCIVTVFGFMPLKSRFTPSYESSFYNYVPKEELLAEGRYFNENEAFYDIRIRNSLYKPKPKVRREPEESNEIEDYENLKKHKLLLDSLKDEAQSCLESLLDSNEVTEVIEALDKLDFSVLRAKLFQARMAALGSNDTALLNRIDKLTNKLANYIK